MNNNFQRENSSSNQKVGNDFEIKAKRHLEKELRQVLTKDFPLRLGVNSSKKERKFDLGNNDIIVECKSHRWTKSDKIPSAKLTVWNEAMFYFYISPKNIRKIFFFERSFSKKRNRTLGEYYISRYLHMIPSDVEMWEYDTQQGIHKILNR